MSARTEKRRQGGISRERLILALIVVAVIVGMTALGLHRKGSLTLDNLLVELGLKEPAAVTISIDDIPEYSGEPYVILQDNQPDFDLEDLTLEPFENYSELDSLGRCGVAYANICLEIMPTEPRGDIGQVKPSGWQSTKYDSGCRDISRPRCHILLTASRRALPGQYPPGARWA